MNSIETNHSTTSQADNNYTIHIQPGRKVAAWRPREGDHFYGTIIDIFKHGALVMPDEPKNEDPSEGLLIRWEDVDLTYRPNGVPDQQGDHTSDSDDEQDGYAVPLAVNMQVQFFDHQTGSDCTRGIVRDVGSESATVEITDDEHLAKYPVPGAMRAVLIDDLLIIAKAPEPPADPFYLLSRKLTSVLKYANKLADELYGPTGEKLRQWADAIEHGDQLELEDLSNEARKQ